MKSNSLYLTKHQFTVEHARQNGDEMEFLMLESIVDNIAWRHNGEMNRGVNWAPQS